MRFGPKRWKTYLWYVVFYLLFFALLLFVAAFGLVAEA
mgnify:FL=1